jgi:pilus assembly protein CpaF
VHEVVAVPGRVENDVIETEALFVRRGDELVRTQGMPPRREHFERAGFDVTSLLAGG